jgi:hypothetical protein
VLPLHEWPFIPRKDWPAIGINLDTNILDDSSPQPWIVATKYFSPKRGAVDIPGRSRIGIASLVPRNSDLFRNTVLESYIELFHDQTNSVARPSIVEECHHRVFESGVLP